MRKITEVPDFIAECKIIEDQAIKLRERFLSKQTELDKAYHENYAAILNSEDRSVSIEYCHEDNNFQVGSNVDGKDLEIVFSVEEMKFLSDQFLAATEDFDFSTLSCDDELSAEAS